MNIFETIADDFSTNAEIERHLEPLQHDDRVLVRDSLEIIKRAGLAGVTKAEWMQQMQSLHNTAPLHPHSTSTVPTEKLARVLTMTLQIFPFLVKKSSVHDSYLWSVAASSEDDIDTSSPMAQLAGMQIRLTGQILRMMQDAGRFSVEEIASQVTAVPHSMALMLVQHVCDTTSGSIKPDGAGYYRWEAEAAPKTPGENMAFWRGLAARKD